MTEKYQALIGRPDNKEVTCPKCGSSCVPIAISYCDRQPNSRQGKEQINIKGWHCIGCDVTYEEV